MNGDLQRLDAKGCDAASLMELLRRYAAMKPRSIELLVDREDIERIGIRNL